MLDLAVAIEDINNLKIINTYYQQPHIPTMFAQKPVMTAAEKEQQIMQEIRNNAVKYENKFEGSFLGDIFTFSVKK
ncbi:hypothetical protein Cantr_09708 [Candida viswanathii]|uniref:Uncharacterized protein n=1 Tax=Candida viswanathii TaxID=5486 RepID=A0A367YBE4_9ASCO|nr:hypothetical protein Cantr_09708 [Candida viswanathii]